MNKNTTPAPVTDCPVCLHDDCEVAATCLFQQTFRKQKQMGKYLRLINPSLCTKQASCPHYMSNEPVRFARGFIHMQEHMLPKQYAKFMTTLILHFGRNQYFKRRKGEILLTPEDQEAVRIVLRNVGADSTMDFDTYVEGLYWTT